MGVKVRNARKSFNFKILMVGINQFEVQNVTLPEKEIEQVEHGDTNYNVKSPGKIIWSNLTTEKLRSATGPDNVMWQWMLSAQSSDAGGGVPLLYERVITLIELAPDGITALNTYIITCWPSKLTHGKHSRNDTGENIIHTAEFAVNEFRQI